ncbi:hypothetical protein CJF31_00005768 [Rutstroemia sp. NJR-2017a BVV2]|nr:hypothetical protein CJF31_00005768 [Rutstroemia sp. NJR-2017a BVV2]
MPEQGSSNSGSSSSGSSSYTPYTVNSTGTNSQGNSYDTRSTPSGDAYHYSNTSKEYIKRKSLTEMQMGRTTTPTETALLSIYNNGSGSSTYTAPNGNTYKN